MGIITLGGIIVECVDPGNVKRASMRTLAWMAVILSALAAGCAAGREDVVTRLRTDDPRVQTATIAEVVRANDKTMVGELINLLDSPDDGVRFMAAAGLHHLTGREVDRRIANPDKRAAVVNEWRQWWEKEGRADARDGKGPAVAG